MLTQDANKAVKFLDVVFIVGVRLVVVDVLDVLS